MTNQLEIAFEVIATDGSRAYFLDNSQEEDAAVFEYFQRSTGISRADLEQAAATRSLVFVNDCNKYFTVGQISTCAELDREDARLNQLEIAFQLISLDGRHIRYVDTSTQEGALAFKAFEQSTNVSLEELYRAVEQKNHVVLRDANETFTVSRIPTEVELEANAAA